MAFEFDATSAQPVDAAPAGFDPSTAQPVKPAGAIRRMADTGLALAKGVIGVPEAAVGVADLVTGGRAGKAVQGLGVRFKDAKQVLTDLQSNEQHAADSQVQAADGFLPTLGAMAQNPSTIINAAAESAPSMILGGGVARGAMALAPKLGAIGAGALGEGVVAAGQNAEQVRQEDPTGTLTAGQSAMLAGSGAATGAISRLSGGIANRLGIGDVQTMLAAGKAGAVGEQAIAKGAQKGIARKIGEGALVEGGLQELPQSAQEQAAQNIAQDKPVGEGVGTAAAQGLLVGGVTGGIAGPLGGHAEVAPAPPAGPLSRAAALALPAPVVNVDSQGRAKMDGVPVGTPDEQQQGVVGRAPIDMPPGPAPLLGLPPPTVTVDAEGNARAPGQMPPAAEPGPRETGAIGQGRNSEPAPTEPTRALSAPVVTVGADGTAATGAQRFNAIQAARERRQALGQPQMTAEGDILAESGKPFKNRMGANNAARKAGAGFVAVPVDGGYVVRKDLQDVQAKNEPISGNVDAAAHVAATSPLNDRPEPTQAQKEAGNYPKGHTRIAGLDLSIENPEGSTRSGTDPNGKRWTTTMAHHYGYVKGTTGNDGDQVDVFVKPGTSADHPGPVFVIDQIDPATGKLDEHKAVIGAADKAEAETIYRANYAKGWKGLGAITELPMPEFKTWVKDGKKDQPLGTLAAAAAPAPVPAGDSAPAQVQPAANGVAGNSGAAVQPNGALNVQTPTPSPGPQTQPAAGEKTPAVGGAAPAQAAIPAAGKPASVEAAGVRPLSVGMTPATAEPATVKNGIVHVGKAEAIDFDSGEPVKAPEGASDAQIKQALKDAGAISRRQKFFGGQEASTTAAPVAQSRAAASGAPTNAEQAAAPQAEASPADAAKPAIKSGENSDLPAAPTIATQSPRQDHAKPTTATTERPANWRSNFLQAARVARDAGINPKGKKLAGLVAEIEAKDGRAGSPASSPEQPTAAAKERVGAVVASAQVESLGKTGGKGPAGGKNARARAREANPFRAFLAEHGLAPKLAKEFAPGLRERRAAMVPGYGPIFRRGGKALDLLAQAAVEDGFLIEPDANKLYSLIARSFSGERIIAQYAEGAAEREAQDAIDARRENEPVAGLADLRENELDLFDDVPDLDSPGNVSLESAMRSMGFTDQEISDAVAKESGSPQADRASNGQPDEAATRPAPQSGGSREGAQGTAQGLSAPNVNESGTPYETDLFGDAIPRQQAFPDTGRSERTESAKPAVPGNVQPASKVRDTQAPQGEYFVNTVVGQETKREVGAARVLTPEQAAQATSYLYRSAVERLDGIVTDKAGRVLAIIGGFKGTTNRASVYPATLIGEAIRIPGAAKVWFSHNHPSGSPTLSHADEHLNNLLASAFRGSGIEPMGLLAVAGDMFGYIDARGDVHSGGEIPAVASSKEVPVIERQLSGRRDALDVISSSLGAKDVARVYYGKANAPGLLMLDAQNRVAAWVPIAGPMNGPLRGTGGLNAIYRAVSQSNATAAIIVHGGELSKRGTLPGTVTESQNIAAALQQIDVHALDVINVKTGKSEAEQGLAISSGPVFRRSNDEPANLRAAEIRAALAPALAALKVPYAIHATLDELKISTGYQQIPRGVKGAHFRGKLHLVAENIAGPLQAEEVFWHEVNHAGLDVMYGSGSKAYEGALRGLVMQNPNIRAAAKAWMDRYGQEDYEARVAAQRAERLKAEGRENLFTDTDISALKTLNAGTFADGTGRAMVYAKALQDLNAFNEAGLKMAMESGLIDQDAFEAMRYDPYVPFYRLMEDGGELPKFGKKGGLTGQQAFKKLKGGTEKLNNDLLQNLLLNWNHLFAASAKNRAAQATMKAAVDLAVAYPVPGGAPSAKGSVKVMEGGKAVHYQVEDPYLLEAISSLNYVPSPLIKPLAAMKHMLTLGVTANPAFKIRNLMRDSLQAMASADLSYNPAKNIADGWAATSRKSQTYASMLASGGLIKFGTQEDTGRARRQIEKLGGQLLDKQGWAKLTHQMADVWEAYQEFGDRGENVNRAALYEKLVKQGKSHAEASFMARDLMDFSMTGQWGAVRFLAQTVPFLNARLIGLQRLAQAAKEDPRRFATVSGSVMLASVALMLGYRDDDDWKRREDFDRDAYWWFKIGDTAFRIPKPFEIGAMGTLAERTAELAIDPEMTGKRFGKRVSAMLFQTFNFDPTPQAFKPLLDVYANQDSFTGRPIENMSDERLRPQDRIGPRTSEVARMLGQLGLPDPAQLAKGQYSPLSPKQMDFLLRGYFGWFGTVAQTVPDYGLRPMLDRGERPAMRLKDVFLAGNFVESLPTGSSRYVSTLYEQAKEIEQAYASYHAALTMGDQEQAASIMESEGPKIRRFHQVERVKRGESFINAQIRRVEASRELSAVQKRDRITELEARRERIARPLTAVQ